MSRFFGPGISAQTCSETAMSGMNKLLSSCVATSTLETASPTSLLLRRLSSSKLPVPMYAQAPSTDIALTCVILG